MPTLTIDGKQVTVEPGTTILQACEKTGIDVPRYCYHPGLSIAGNCRICMVDVEKAPKPAISCKELCTDGMVVHTQNERVKELRSHVLEFLLLNHPLDCPVCDQAGECFLQDYYMKHGLYDPKFNEDKVKKTKKATPIGPTVMLDQERCILCSRCVRFTDEITKTHEFGIVNRGDHSEITVSKEFENPYSGNVVDICPVGALTDRDFRFKCRVWYLKSKASICTGCSRGCNIDIHTNGFGSHIAEGKRVMRYKPRVNMDVNKWWMCDEGRYGYTFIDDNRLTQVKGAEDWTAAIRLVASKLKAAADASPKSVAVLLSPQQSNEELFLALEFFGRLVGRDRLFLVSPNRPGREDEFLMRADKNPNTAGARMLGFEPREDTFAKLTAEADRGTLKTLYLFGQDLVTLFGEEARQLLKKMDTVVFQGSNRNETAPLTSVVLPSAVFAEDEGTFVNCDGIVQRFYRALPPMKGAWEGSKIISALAGELKITLPQGRSEEVFKILAERVAAFKGMNYTNLRPVKEKVLV